VEQEQAAAPLSSRPFPAVFRRLRGLDRLTPLLVRPRNTSSRMDASGGAEAANGGIEGSADPCSSSGGYRLSVHQIAGGGNGSFFSPTTPVLRLRLASRIGPELRERIREVVTMCDVSREIQLFYFAVLAFWLWPTQASVLRCSRLIVAGSGNGVYLSLCLAQVSDCVPWFRSQHAMLGCGYFGRESR
jgi:hypothetical protein